MMNFESFNNVASCSALSGARRIVLREDKTEVDAMGFWKQFIMSFTARGDRIERNRSVIDSFREALKKEYGEAVYDQVVKGSELDGKLQNGTKLLSRDVHYYIGRCKQEKDSYPLLVLGENWQDDNQHVKDIVNNNVEDEENEFNYEDLLQFIKNSVEKESLSIPEKISDEEVVSIWHCARSIVAFKPTFKYDDKVKPEYKICQERMNDQLGGIRVDEEIKPMTRTAIRGLNKLDNYKGYVVERRDQAKDLSEYKIGRSYYPKRFATGTKSNANLWDKRATKTYGTYFVYNMQGTSCKDISSITSDIDNVVIQPDAKFICTRIEHHAKGNVLFFDEDIGK